MRTIIEKEFEGEINRNSWLRTHLPQLLAVLFALFVCTLIVVFREAIAGLGYYGYLSAFLVPMLCCATIVVPVPGLIIVFTLGAVLNPLLVGIISGIGGTIGETTG